VVEQIFPTQSLLFVNTDDVPQKLGNLLGSLVVIKLKLVSVKYLLGLYLIVHQNGIGGSVGHLAKDHLEKDNPNRPDISLHNSQSTFSP